MPLRHQLRTDDDVGFAAPDLFDLFLERAGRAKEVGRQDGDFRVGEKLGHFFGHTLHTRTNGVQFAFGLTVRADLWHGFGFAALVAHEPFEEPMFHHPRVAMITGDLMPAGATNGERRVSTAV